MNFLPVIPPEAVQIGTSCFAVVFGDERVDYYANLEPFDFHRIDQRNAMLMRVGRFRAINDIKTGHLMEVFTLSRSTVERARKRYLEGGEAAFFEPRKGRGLSALTPERAERATRLLAEGLSGRAVADELSVSAASVYNWINKGLIGSRQNRDDEGATPEAGEPASDRSARDQRDRQAVMGRATCDTIGRVLASVGQAGPVMPRFEAARGVPCGGVLTALPALLREGLLSAAELLSPLPRGYYSPATIFLCIAFMFMARIRTPESLRYHAPGEWGAILGHDRAPEARTLRNKIGLIAADETRVGAWQSTLASQWQAGDPDSWATLCVDGHVKVYAGRKGRLPRHFVARQKLCLPASTSYWVNALGGQPLLCLHKPLDPRMVHALEHDVVPALDRLGVLDRARPGAPAVTLVFDRPCSGVSPAAALPCSPGTRTSRERTGHRPTSTRSRCRSTDLPPPAPAPSAWPKNRSPSLGTSRSGRSGACLTPDDRSRSSPPTSNARWLNSPAPCSPDGRRRVCSSPCATSSASTPYRLTARRTARRAVFTSGARDQE